MENHEEIMAEVLNKIIIIGIYAQKIYKLTGNMMVKRYANEISIQGRACEKLLTKEEKR